MQIRYDTNEIRKTQLCDRINRLLQPSLCAILMTRTESAQSAKSRLWTDFVIHHRLAEDCVPLFDVAFGQVNVRPYGRDSRLVLKRSTEMDSLMRGLGGQLIQEYDQSRVVHDGILYMMLKIDSERIIPLYVGKTETYGKGDKNLSANISDLAGGNGKFGRWGYNYAYHVGDLSAVTLTGHPESKKTAKYSAWRDAMFTIENGIVTQNSDIRFWACLWGRDSQSIWQDYGNTKLAFEEYLVIGVASDLYPNDLLNREGRTR
jgi:hypothetical protein